MPHFSKFLLMLVPLLGIYLPVLCLVNVYHSFTTQSSKKFLLFPRSLYSWRLFSVLAHFLVQTWEDFSATFFPEITVLKKKIVSDGFATHTFGSSKVFLNGLPGMGGGMTF